MKNLAATNVKWGLASSEAKARLVKFGRNEFEKKREFLPLRLLLTQFKSPLIYVLGVAGVVTLLMQDWIDATVIWLVVMVNSLLGFWQEFKAAKSLEALKSYLKPMVAVLRDSKRQEILMAELVPGDLVYLDAGLSVPADGLVIESQDLLLNEAILTGESRPVEKNVKREWEEKNLSELQPPPPQDELARNFVYMGTSVASGLGMMQVSRTGGETEMGKIAKSLSTTEESLTPLQQRLEHLARYLVFVVVGAAAVIVVMGLLRGEDAVEMVETAIAMAVAAVPEGLAVSMTVILALGMQRILKRKALVRKLVAAETLGSVSVICSDKTGTLTEGKMRVVDYVGNRDELIRAAILANDERDEEGMAMSEWAQLELGKMRVTWAEATKVKEVRELYQRINSIPFSSERKHMATLNLTPKGLMVFVSGAPEKVLDRCQISGEKKQEELEKVEELARKGYRLIGMAEKKLGNRKQEAGNKIHEADLEKMDWLGFVGFEDPVRENVKQALEEARKAGVEVKVITGDYQDTAIAVMRRLLPSDQHILEKHVMTGEELAKLSESQLMQRIGEVKLFARTTPDQKLKIVGVLKRMGEVVAMTGDGVNDAPALKSSDIGVVVNEASDVSKQTADMVLLDSNFKTIVEAIREGRVIFETMKKVLVYLVSNSFQEIVLIGGSLFLGLPIPLSAVQILWINMVQDSLPGLALAFDTTDEGVMQQKPVKREGNLFDREGVSLIVVIGLAANFILLSIYYLFYKIGFDVEYLQSMMFLGLTTNTLIFIFSVKAMRKNLWNENLLDNTFLLGAVAFSLLLVFLTMTWAPLRSFVGLVPLQLEHVLLMLGANAVSLLLIELVKWLFIHGYARE